MSKDNNSKTLNNLVSFFADEVEVAQTLTIPVVYAYPATDGLYNGQLEYYQNALFVWGCDLIYSYRAPSQKRVI